MTPVDGDAAVLARLRLACADWPEVEEAELQDRPLFRVRRKRFAILNGAASPERPRWHGCGRSLHILTDPIERAALEQDPRFTASPHHGDRGWMACALDPATTDWAEIAELLETAYRQAAPAELLVALDRRSTYVARMAPLTALGRETNEHPPIGRSQAGPVGQALGVRRVDRLRVPDARRRS